MIGMKAEAGEENNPASVFCLSKVKERYNNNRLQYKSEKICEKYLKLCNVHKIERKSM